jgi:Uma2 family endonuclease
VTAAVPSAERNLGCLTVGELYDRFGRISLSRLRLDRYPATESDVLELDDHEDRHCELVDAILVEKATGFLEGQIAIELARLLADFVDRQNLGVVNGEGGMMKLAPGLVRIPDISFISWSQFPGAKIPRTPIPSIYPDLAVEVLSEGNTPKEMEEKRRDYFAAGTRLVWIVDSEARTVAVYTPENPEVSMIFTEADTVVGDPVLPGFSFPVAKLFEKLARA